MQGKPPREPQGDLDRTDGPGGARIEATLPGSARLHGARWPALQRAQLVIIGGGIRCTSS